MRARVDDSYWDTERTDRSDGCGLGTCPIGGGLITTEMQDGSSPSALGPAFQQRAGQYPKLYQCEPETCTEDDLSDVRYSSKLVVGQD